MCPTCHGDGSYIGALGRLNWYRCRQCGMMFTWEGGDDD
jgi:hypothetical protein